MQKTSRLSILIVLLFVFLFFISASSSQAADDGLLMIAPTECPQGGCAAGQRLNFNTQFSTLTNNSQTNVQVCIYAPEKGSQDGDGPWASFELGWISKTGIISGETYTEGQTDSVCTEPNNIEDGDMWLNGAYAQLKTTTNDKLEFALHLHPKADLDGYVRVKVFEAAENNDTWIGIANFTKPIKLVKRKASVFVASDPEMCGNNSPCFVNSGDDLEYGLGTGLRDAVLTVNAGDEIRILKEYVIKSQAVLVDKAVHIRGKNNALITYLGTECTNPMLKFVQGGTLEELTINDGNCFNPSRNLIEVDSPSPVFIEHNTLNYGNRAINVLDNSGDVEIAFNHITNNDAFAVVRAPGDSNGEVNIYANNIVNNTTGYQVECGSKGTANHNFWGVGISAPSSAHNCVVSNGKRLGALIHLSTTQPGVDAQRLRVTTTLSYVFDGKVGARNLSGDDFDLIVVNHGQGAVSNIPFYETASGNIQPCSNFYDIFLADDAVADKLLLALNYSQNNNCITKIESSEYCGGTDSSKYPLLWFDPATSATDGWDHTGGPPQGPGAGGASGQETTCHLDAKEIRVLIDNSGRPGISNDLNFTPFVIGLPLDDGITLTQLTAQFVENKVNIKWITNSEINVKGFYVLRADSKNGPYARISDQIEAIGDMHIGGIYQHVDGMINYSRDYFYKIEVINKDGQSISTYGPVSVLTATATPTATNTGTPTRTPFYYRSPTPFYQYRTPTPIFQQRTATPVSWPTPVRTAIRTEVGIEDLSPYPTYDGLSPDDAYPGMETQEPEDWEQTPPKDAYPAPETATPTATLITPEDDFETPDAGIEGDEDLPLQNFRWIFIIIGAAGGLSLLGAISVILAKSRYS
jgi:hypothetical protein